MEKQKELKDEKKHQEEEEHNNGMSQEAISLRPQTMYGSMKSTASAWTTKSAEKRATFASLLKSDGNEQHQQQQTKSPPIRSINQPGGSARFAGGNNVCKQNQNQKPNQKSQQTGNNSLYEPNVMSGAQAKVSMKQFHFTREELLSLYKTTSLPSSLPKDHGIPVLSDVCLPPVCSDAWKPEDIYKQWESSLQQRGTGGRGRGRGRGQNLQNRFDQDDSASRMHNDHDDSHDYNDQRNNERAKDLWDDVKTNDGDKMNEAASLGNFVEATELFRREMEKMKQENPRQFMSEDMQVTGQFDDTTDEQTADGLWDAPVADTGKDNDKLGSEENERAFEEPKQDAVKVISSIHNSPQHDLKSSTSHLPTTGPLADIPFKLDSSSSYDPLASLSTGSRPILGLDLVSDQQHIHQSIVSGSSATIDEWYYLDPQGNEQGPFKSDEMRGWYEAGYFKPNLPLRRSSSNSFKALKIHFPDESKCFQQPKKVDLPFSSGVDPVIAAALQPQLFNAQETEHRLKSLFNNEQLLRPANFEDKGKDTLSHSRVETSSSHNVSSVSCNQASPKNPLDMFSQIARISSPKEKPYQEATQPRTWASIQKPHATDLLEIQRQEEHNLLQKMSQKHTDHVDIMANVGEQKEKTPTSETQSAVSSLKVSKKSQPNKTKESNKTVSNNRDQSKQSAKAIETPQYTKNDLENMGQHLKKMLGVGIGGLKGKDVPSPLPQPPPSSAWNNARGPRPRALRDILAEEEAAKKMQNQATTTKPGASPWLNVVAGPHQTRSANLIPTSVSASSAIRSAGETEEDKQFWDIDRTQERSSQGSVSKRSSGKGSSSSSLDLLGSSPVLQEFMLWCNRQFESLGKTIDPTVIQFCFNLGDPGEIRECFAACLGSTPKVSAFATEFIERKKLIRQQKKSDKTTTAATGGKKQKKNKVQK